MNDEPVYRTASATPGLLKKRVENKDNKNKTFHESTLKSSNLYLLLGVAEDIVLKHVVLSLPAKQRK